MFVTLKGRSRINTEEFYLDKFNEEKDDFWRLSTAEDTKTDENENIKKSWMDKLGYAILGITAMTNSAYAIIGPFMPFEFKAKHID